MKQAVTGVAAFFAMALISVIGFFSVQHYFLVDQLKRNLYGQCVVVEDKVIKAAVDADHKYHKKPKKKVKKKKVKR